MKNYFIYFVLVAFISCGVESSKEDNKPLSSSAKTTIKEDKELLKKKEENKKLEKLRYYLNNSLVTDENGIRYNLSVKKKTIAKSALYESKKIQYISDYSQFDVTVKSYKMTTLFELYANGELKDKVQLEGYLLESKRSDKNDVFTRCNDTYTYYPKLEDEVTRKRKISKFTGANCGLGEKVNNQVINARIKAVNSCGNLK